MKRFALSLVVCCLMGTGRCAFADDGKVAQPATKPILVGPETEKRFPPLTVPDGFKATLFACDPLIEYPSVIAVGPQPGTLFVAHDYMTGLGLEIVRRDEVRLIRDSNQDGYADHSTVYAGEFNSIQGLAFHDGYVFVMHSPLLTRLRDTNGDGQADERRDLIAGLGLLPEKNPNRLHCANGVVAGHDGWLYLALGDRGCDVKRPEGDRLLFQQGGILRCRIDGSDLHVFSTGLRNIYDIALDDELNVFVRDNENDGGDYMIRVCHCFFGSDHGYPYHYYERPREAMPPLADLGRGSSAGGTTYLESAFPTKYQRSLFFCEWGRAVVRYEKSPVGRSFKPMTEVDFAAGAANDPYGFKPTDVVVDRDGSLLISDWCDGQRPKRGRGRIYRVSYVGPNAAPPQKQIQPHLKSMKPEQLLTALNSPSYYQRVDAQLELQRRRKKLAPSVKVATDAFRGLGTGAALNPHARMHALWSVVDWAQQDAIEGLFWLTQNDPDERVRVQAMRAIGDLTDPVLVKHRLNAGRGDQKMAERIALVARKNTRWGLDFDAVILFRRMHWQGTAKWVAERLHSDNGHRLHAAQQALRYSDDWPAVVELLSGSDRSHRVALRAVAEQRVPFIADQLIKHLERSDNPRHRMHYAEALARIVRKEPPWTYWGYRPAPRPAATVDWEKTPAIVAALNRTLEDRDFDVRDIALSSMMREGVTPEFTRLSNWLKADTSISRVAGILTALRSSTNPGFAPLMHQTVRRTDLGYQNRIAALTLLIDRQRKASTSELVRLGVSLDDGPVLTELLREFGALPKLDADALLMSKLESSAPKVRAAAIRSLGQRKHKPASKNVALLLQDSEPNVVRLAAAEAAGLLHAEASIDNLLKLAAAGEPLMVAISLNSLRALGSNRAVVAAGEALKHREAQLPALNYLADHGSPEQLETVVRAAASNPSIDVQQAACSTFVAWIARFPKAAQKVNLAMGTLHGLSGQPLAWNVSGPLSQAQFVTLSKQLTERPQIVNSPSIRRVVTSDINSEIRLPHAPNAKGEHTWLAWTPLRIPLETKTAAVPDGTGSTKSFATSMEMLASATGQFKVRLNGDEVYSRTKAAGFRQDSDRVNLDVPADVKLLVVEIRSSDKAPRFHLRLRRRSSKAEHEQLTQYALTSRGNANRGREVFLNAEKSSCVRCHRLDSKGARIGPDLSGIGRRFSRIHLIESILEPSRTVAPSYATISVALQSGKVLSGIKVSEMNGTLVLGDNQGKLHQLATADIEERTVQKQSTMPDGLEKKLTNREFIDLLAFLESLRQ